MVKRPANNFLSQLADEIANVETPVTKIEASPDKFALLEEKLKLANKPQENVSEIKVDTELVNVTTQNEAAFDERLEVTTTEAPNDKTDHQIENRESELQILNPDIQNSELIKEVQLSAETTEISVDNTEVDVKKSKENIKKKEIKPESKTEKSELPKVELGSPSVISQLDEVDWMEWFVKHASADDRALEYIAQAPKMNERPHYERGGQIGFIFTAELEERLKEEADKIRKLRRKTNMSGVTSEGMWPWIVENMLRASFGMPPIKRTR